MATENTISDIVVKVEADIKGAIEQIKKIEKEDVQVKVAPDDALIQKLKEELKQINDKKVTVKIDTSTKSFDDAKQKIKDIRTQLKDIGEKIKKVKIDKNAFPKEELERMKSQLEQCYLKAEAIRLVRPGKEAANLADRAKSLSSELAKAAGEGANVTATFDKLAITLGSLAGNLIFGALGALKQALKETVGEGAILLRQLDAARAKTQTISGASTGEINAQLSRMSKDTGVDERLLSEALYQTVSAIGDITDKYKLLDTANKLAKTGFTDVMQAVDGLTTVLNAYGMEASEAARVADVFVKAQKYGKMTVAEFQGELYKTVPVATQLGLTIEDIAGSLAHLTARGTKAAVAQTQMAAFMRELLSSDTELSEFSRRMSGMSVQAYMEQGNNIFDYIKDLKEYAAANRVDVSSLLGSSESQKFWLSMSQDLDALKSKIEGVSGGINALDTNYSNMMDTMTSRMERANAYMDQFKKAMGEAYNSVTVAIGDIITGYDAELSARQHVNNAINEGIKALKELAGENDLTKEQQEELNKSLETLQLLAPDVYAAYMEFRKGALSYADMLDIVANKQKYVINQIASVQKAQTQARISDITKDRAKNARDLARLVAPYSSGGYAAEEMWQFGAFSDTDSLIKRIQNNDEISKIKDAEKQLKALELYQSIKTQTAQIEEERRNITGIEQNAKEAYEKDLQRIQDLKQQNAVKNSALAVAFQIGEGINKIAEQATVETNKPEQRKTQKQITLERDQKLNEIADKELEDYKNASDENTRRIIRENASRAQELVTAQAAIDLKRAEIEDKRAQIRNEEKDESGTYKNDTAESIYQSILQNEEELKQLVRNYEFLRLDKGTTESTGGSGARTSANVNTRAVRGINDEIIAISNDYKQKELQLTEQYLQDLKEFVQNGDFWGSRQLTEDFEKDRANLQFEQRQAQLLANLNRTDVSDTEKKNYELMYEQNQLEKETRDIQLRQEEQLRTLNETMETVGGMMENLSSAVYSLGGDGADVTSGVTGILGSVTNALGNIVNIGSGKSGIIGSISKALSTGTAGKVLSTATSVFSNLNKGTMAGNITSSLVGGGNTKEGNIGSTLGTVAGGLVGGGIGSIVGGALGGLVGGLFGSKSSKKKKREAKKYQKAAEELKENQKIFEDEWTEYLEQFSEGLERAGAQRYINLYNQLQGKTSESTILSKLKANYQENKGYAYGVSMDTLRELLPQYTDEEIMNWFRAQTGGAELVGDYLQTGKGKYGLFDISGLAENLASVNKTFSDNLKSEIKSIINFTADQIASTVQQGFGEGLEDLGDNLEKMVANSLKSAFMNTDMAKSLFNGLSDSVSDMVKSMFTEDANLGVSWSMDNLKGGTPQDYIAAITEYMKASNEKLEEVFTSLGLSIDNLDDSIDTLNSNLSRNTVQGMATNLWKFNAGQSISNEFTTIEIPVYIGTEKLEKIIKKVENDSLSKARRNRFA